MKKYLLVLAVLLMIAPIAIANTIVKTDKDKDQVQIEQVLDSMNTPVAEVINDDVIPPDLEWDANVMSTNTETEIEEKLDTSQNSTWIESLLNDYGEATTSGNSHMQRNVKEAVMKKQGWIDVIRIDYLLMKPDPLNVKMASSVSSEILFEHGYNDTGTTNTLDNLSETANITEPEEINGGCIQVAENGNDTSGGCLIDDPGVGCENDTSGGFAIMDSTAKNNIQVCSCACC